MLSLTAKVHYAVLRSGSFSKANLLAKETIAVVQGRVDKTKDGKAAAQNREDVHKEAEEALRLLLDDDVQGDKSYVKAILGRVEMGQRGGRGGEVVHIGILSADEAHGSPN